MVYIYIYAYIIYIIYIIYIYIYCIHFWGILMVNIAIAAPWIRHGSTIYHPFGRHPLENPVIGIHSPDPKVKILIKNMCLGPEFVQQCR